MNIVKYVGPEAKNIGRFGWVEPGALLILTDNESDCIKGNPEFAPATDPEQKGPTSPLIERESKHQRILDLELHEKSLPELLAIVEEMKKDGYQFEPIPQHVSRAEVIFKIKSAEEVFAKTEGQDVQTPEGDENPEPASSEPALVTPPVEPPPTAASKPEPAKPNSPKGNKKGK